MMELYMGQIGLRLVRGSTRFSRNLTRLSAPLPSYELAPRFGATLFGRLGEKPETIRANFPTDKYPRAKIFSLSSETRVRSFLPNHVSQTGNLRNRNSRDGCDFLRRRLYSDQIKKDGGAPTAASTKPNIFQKMKQMTKDYWHILIPVHVVTSIGWMLIFYTAAKNSVDVIWIMEKLRFGERYIEALRGSSAGFWAVAYALYKIFTPLRYMVTVGGTTLSIRYLDRMGIMKLKLRRNPAQNPRPEKAVGKAGESRAEPPKT